METLKNMNQSDNTILKEPKRRKITDNILVLYLLATLLILFGQTAGMLLGFLPFMTGSDAAITVYMYISFIGLWAVALLYMRFTKKNRPILLAIGSRASGNNVRNLLIGFIIGFGLNGICILAAWLHGDITLYYDSFQPLSYLSSSNLRQRNSSAGDFYTKDYGRAIAAPPLRSLEVPCCSPSCTLEMKALQHYPC